VVPEKWNPENGRSDRRFFPPHLQWRNRPAG